MTVGRLGYGYEGAPIRLTDPMASAGRHAVLRKTPNGVIVQDMGSTNTTMLNGARLRGGPALLHVGDEVQTGRSLLRFEHTLVDDSWPNEACPLLSVILTSPSDDRPRRVLADWLLEHDHRSVERRRDDKCHSTLLAGSRVGFAPDVSRVNDSNGS